MTRSAKTTRRPPVVEVQPAPMPLPPRPPLMPATTPDFMVDAWVSCLRWAIGDDKVREEFVRATGVKWTPAKSGLEKAIDEATGADKAFAEAFVAWFNENVWGNEPYDDGEGEASAAPADRAELLRERVGAHKARAAEVERRLVESIATWLDMARGSTYDRELAKKLRSGTWRHE